MVEIGNNSFFNKILVFKKGLIHTLDPYSPWSPSLILLAVAMKAAFRYLLYCAHSLKEWDFGGGAQWNGQQRTALDLDLHCHNHYQWAMQVSLQLSLRSNWAEVSQVCLSWAPGESLGLTGAGWLRSHLHGLGAPSRACLRKGIWQQC